MALTNPATILAPRSITRVAVSTTTGDNAVAITGPGWYEFKSVGATSWVLFGAVSGIATVTSSNGWPILAGQKEAFQLREDDAFFKALGSAAGNLYRRRTGS